MKYRFIYRVCLLISCGCTMWNVHSQTAVQVTYRPTTWSLTGKLRGLNMSSLNVRFGYDFSVGIFNMLFERIHYRALDTKEDQATHLLGLGLTVRPCVYRYSRFQPILEGTALIPLKNEIDRYYKACPAIWRAALGLESYVSNRFCIVAKIQFESYTISPSEQFSMHYMFISPSVGLQYTLPRLGIINYKFQ